MDAPSLSRDYLERQLTRVKQVVILSYLFSLLALPFLLYGMSRGHFGLVLAGFAWLAISMLQRYRALRVRLRLEERLRTLEGADEHDLAG